MPNQAHIGDIVGITVGELKGQEGTIVALGSNGNRCIVRIAPDDDEWSFDENAHADYPYDGAELKLIECYHMGITTGE